MKKIEDRLNKIESKIIAQEHRASKIVTNIVKYSKEESNPDKTKAAWLSLVSYILKQRTLTLVISFVSGLGFFLSTYLLYQQNQLVKHQNLRIDQQTELLEADRRSSLIFLMSDLLNKIDNEISSDFNDDNLRNLSKILIARIAARSNSFKPYKYLKNGNLIPEALSPERTELLIYLLNLNLEKTTLIEIFSESNFSHLDLENLTLKEKFLMGIKMPNSNLSNVKFENVILDAADLENSNIISCKFQYSSFQETNFEKCKFTLNNRFEFCNLIFANFYNPTFDNYRGKNISIYQSIITHIRLNKSFDLSKLRMKMCISHEDFFHRRLFGNQESELFKMKGFEKFQSKHSITKFGLNFNNRSSNRIDGLPYNYLIQEPQYIENKCDHNERNFLLIFFKLLSIKKFEEFKNDSGICQYDFNLNQKRTSDEELKKALEFIDEIERKKLYFFGNLYGRDSKKMFEQKYLLHPIEIKKTLQKYGFLERR